MMHTGFGNWLGKGLARIAALAVSVSLVACGGGGAGGQGGSGNSSASSAGSLQLLTNKSALLSDGSVTATITALVKDANNNVLPNQVVTISTSDAYVVVTPAASPLKTGTAGTATATVQLMSGATAAMVNRNVTFTGTVGSVTQTLVIPVTGTQVAFSDGPNTLSQGATGTYKVTLKDGGGNAIAGAPIGFVSALGNPVSPSSTTTDGSGNASFVLTASAVGADTLSATALNATGTKAVTVAGAGSVSGLTFTPSTLSVPVNQASSAIKFVYTANSVPQVGQPVVLALTRGTFAGCTVGSGNSCTSTTVTTDASGAGTVQVQSPSAGSSTLTAFPQSDASLTSSAAIQFYSGAANASKITMSSSASAVGLNPPGGTSNNKVSLIAVVRDVSDNPVQGASVLFSALSDPSGGSVTPAIAVTDATGTATATFTAGGSSTALNAVVLQAQVATNTALTSTTSLTVNQAAYFVDLGTGNTISAKDATSYQMPWTAIVTDASQAAVSGQTVTPSMAAAYDGDPTNPSLKYYYKGVWVYSGTSWAPRGWTDAGGPNGAPTACLNEDVNHNNILDAGEDKNGNGRLDPGSPASVAVSGTTDANGNVPITVTYPKSFGLWVDVTLKATIGTTGTQSTALRTFLLPDLAGDLTSATVAPPSVNANIYFNGAPYLKGPYGAEPDRDANGFCTNPN